MTGAARIAVARRRAQSGAGSRPRSLRDWSGRHVRLKQPLSGPHGRVVPAGSIGTVLYRIPQGLTVRVDGMTIGRVRLSAVRLVGDPA
jgi:hypothetical protein